MMTMVTMITTDDDDDEDNYDAGHRPTNSLALGEGRKHAANCFGRMSKGNSCGWWSTSFPRRLPIPSLLSESPPYPLLYLRPSISLHRHAPRASASCVFLSLGATLSSSEQAAWSLRFSPSLSSSLVLPFSLPLPLVLGRRRNPLDVSESLVLFYQLSVVDRPECDWPSVGTILGRFWIAHRPIATPTRWRRADQMHTRSTRCSVTVSLFIDQWLREICKIETVISRCRFTPITYAPVSSIGIW